MGYRSIYHLLHYFRLMSPKGYRMQKQGLNEDTVELAEVVVESGQVLL